MRSATLITLGLAVVTARTARAEVFEITPADDLIAAVAALQPGDELVLGGGTYELTARFGISVSGTEEAPIVIRAADGEVPIITRPDAGQNAINLDEVSWVTLRGLEVVGGSHGIRITDSQYVTIERCHVHDTGDVGISANVPGSNYEGLWLKDNHIHDTNDTGEGMYLGCNDNGCQVHDSIIERNWIHHTNGPTIVQGDGIELKEGSYANVIRHNVVHDTNYPCIITYSTVGNGAPNRIEGNAMWGCGDHGIQSAADVEIINNVILGASADAIRNQPHQSGAPSNILVAHNTILKPAGDAIRADGITGAVTIVNNAIYAQSGNAIRVAGDLTGVVTASNVGMGSLQGVAGGFDASGAIAVDFAGASFSGDVPNDVFPVAGSPLVGAADPAFLEDLDFNGSQRAGALDVGAYAFDARGNPGWTLAEEPKTFPSGAGGGGGGPGSGSGGGGAGAGGGGGDGSGLAATSGPISGGGDAASDGGGDGCDCRASSSPSAGAHALGALALAGLLRRRKSRR